MLSDKEKFEQIYYTYYRLLYFIACQILNQKEDAEEAVQETFIRISQNISKISEPICPKTKNFVVIICRNVALSMLKRKRRIKIEELTDYVSDNRREANPETVAGESDVIQIVTEEILALPPLYRDCLYMELIEELDNPEIADILGLKGGTVRKRIQRGKKLLKEKLEKRGVSYGY